MVIMPREMLKLRKGDSAIMIKADGSIEMAGVHDKEIVSKEGHISPIILFAAAWAKKDQNVLSTLVNNFKNCVREGYFGQGAKEDLKNAEIGVEKKRLEEEKKKLKIEATQTPEEYAKQKEEEKRLEAIASVGQDPKVKKQLDTLTKDADVVKKSDKIEGYVHQPDLPVEQTMKYQKASPEEKKKMKINEEGVDDENK
tara:strand:- start:1138 stop:1731 length:594 start_codon:yes stop_codon:yes gene_type:complete